MAAALMMDADPALFFHHTTVAEIVSLTGRGIVVYGVRGGGKTVLLSRLQEEIKGAKLVRGRNREVSRRRLAELAAGMMSCDVLVDDCDRLLRSARGAAPDPEIVRSLWTLKERVVETKWRLVLVLNENPTDLLDYDPDLSDLIQSSETVEMKPWTIPWTALLRDEIVDRYPTKIGAVAVKVFGQSLLLTERLIDAWIKTLIELSGGHPTLVGPAMALLAARIEEGDSSGSVDGDTPQPSNFIPALEAHLARNGIPYLRRRIKKLRESEVPLDKAASELLTQIAEEDEALSATDTPSVDAGRTLERECLAYLDETEGVYRILGTIIRQEVRRTTGERRGASDSFHVVPTPGDDKKGAVIAERSGEMVEIAFEGSPWLVLRLLDQSRGKTVSLAQIEQATELSVPAIRTALQRLSTRLRERRLGGLIENVRGTGYRLVPRSSGGEDTT